MTDKPKNDVENKMREAKMTFYLGMPHAVVMEQMTRFHDLVCMEATIKAATAFAKQPATVPVDVIEKLTAEDVVLLPAEAALNEGVLRLPEYVGALARPTSNQLACEAWVSATLAVPAPLRPITTAPAAELPRMVSSVRFLPTVVTKFLMSSSHLTLPCAS